MTKEEDLSWVHSFISLYRLVPSDFQDDRNNDPARAVGGHRDRRAASIPSTSRLRGVLSIDSRAHERCYINVTRVTDSKGCYIILSLPGLAVPRWGPICDVQGPGCQQQTRVRRRRTVRIWGGLHSLFFFRLS